MDQDSGLSADWIKEDLGMARNRPDSMEENLGTLRQSEAELSKGTSVAQTSR